MMYTTEIVLRKLLAFLMLTYYSFLELNMGFCIYVVILDLIWITDKSLLRFKFSKSGQILRVDITGFPKPGHMYT